MNELVKVLSNEIDEDTQFKINADGTLTESAEAIVKRMADIDFAMSKLKIELDAWKEVVMNEMTRLEVDKLYTDDVKFNVYAPTTSTKKTPNYKKLKEDGLYEKYVKETEVERSGYLRVEFK